jgi:hypothetical protein
MKPTITSEELEDITMIEDSDDTLPTPSCKLLREEVLMEWKFPRLVNRQIKSKKLEFKLHSEDAYRD